MLSRRPGFTFRLPWTGTAMASGEDYGTILEPLTTGHKHQGSSAARAVATFMTSREEPAMG
jgi:hypothetical protein